MPDYGLPRGGCLPNLADPSVMADAIASGLVWDAPEGAQRYAIARIADGTYPVPPDVPTEWVWLLLWLCEHPEVYVP